MCVLQDLHISPSIGDCIERASEREREQEREREWADRLSGHFIWNMNSYIISVWTSSWSLHLTICGGGGILQLILVLHLKIWTQTWSWSFIWQDIGGNIWPSWALHLQTWPAKMSFNNNITYYTWQIWALMVEISEPMSVAMWNYYSWPLAVSSNMKLPFLTTRCQWQCESTILDH